MAVNIGTGVETSVLELITALEEAAGRQAAVRFEAERPGELRRNALAVSRAEAVLGWRPERTLGQGLTDLRDHFQRSGS